MKDNEASGVVLTLERGQAGLLDGEAGSQGWAEELVCSLKGGCAAVCGQAAAGGGQDHTAEH